MESNVPQDLVVLALQIQTLTASMEELTRQNQEMRLQLQQEDNRSETNRDDDGGSQRRDDRRQLAIPEGTELEPSSRNEKRDGRAEEHNQRKN